VICGTSSRAAICEVQLSTPATTLAMLNSAAHFADCKIAGNHAIRGIKRISSGPPIWTSLYPQLWRMLANSESTVSGKFLRPHPPDRCSNTTRSPKADSIRAGGLVLIVARLGIRFSIGVCRDQVPPTKAWQQPDCCSSRLDCAPGGTRQYANSHPPFQRHARRNAGDRKLVSCADGTGTGSELIGNGGENSFTQSTKLCATWNRRARPF
jgi:hypothetical protein